MDRTWMTAVFSALLVAMPLWADNGPDKDAGSKGDATAAAAASAKKNSPAKPKDKGKDAEKPAASFGAEIEQLREMVMEQAKQMEAQQQLMRDQQDKLNALTEELRAARTPAAAPAAAQEQNQDQKVLEGQVEAVADATNELTKKVASLEKDYQGEKKSLNEKVKGLGPFTFSGDIRARYEPFFGGGAENSTAPPDRHRQRFRLRFNVNAKLNDEISGGFTLSSGNIGDPISTNQTEGDFLNRKPVAIDRAFITYHPKYFKPFSITGGKYGYTWLRTELTLDNDLNPEGVSEQVMWDWKNKFLSHFGVVAFQTPLFEIGGNNSTVSGPLAQDSAIFGGQVQTGWRLGSRIKLVADVAYYDYRNADRIARNHTNGNGFASSGTATGVGGGTGDGTFGFGGSTNTNNVVNVVSGTTTTRFFASKFGILDAILRADFDTGSARWPVYALINFAQNTRACRNRDAVNAFVATLPATPPPTFNFTCDPRQRQAYWAEASIGRTAEKGDFRFAYTFARIERDAVVAAYNFSDLRQPTNVAQHRIEAFYQAYKNVTLGFTGLIGRQLLTSQSATPERWLKRLQFDVVYRF